MAINRLSKVILIISVIIFLSQPINAQTQNGFLIENDAEWPDIALDSSGKFHICYINKTGIFYHVFNSSLNEIKPAKNIAPPYYSYPYFTGSVIGINSDYAVVLWNKYSWTFNSYIYCRTLNLKTDSLDMATNINDSYGDAYRGAPNIAKLDDSLFIAAWTGMGFYTHLNSGVYGRILSLKKGVYYEPFAIGDVTDNLVESTGVKLISSGKGEGFFAFWTDNRTSQYKVYGRSFKADGTPKGDSFLLSDGKNVTSIGFLSADINNKGDIIVAWSAEIDSTYWQVQAKWFTKGGESVTEAIRVASGPDKVAKRSDIAAAIDSTGRSVVLWGQNKPTPVLGQRFNPDYSFNGIPFSLISLSDTLGCYPLAVRIYQDRIYTFTCSYSKVYAFILDYNNPLLEVQSEPANSSIAAFNLAQNYPNPFNPATTIFYSIAEQSHVKLKVFDLLGCEVASLVNHIQSAGEHKVQFDAASLPSGVYIYTIQAGQFRDSKKLLLLK